MRRMLVIASLAGCTTSGSSNDFVVSGGVSGSAPQSSRVAALWTVASASTAYQYKFGDGTASVYEFVLTLSGDPPPAAINASGLAIGAVVMVPADTQISDGVYTGGATQLGITTDYAIVWKDPRGAGLGTWDRAFAARYSCARCVRPATGLANFELTGCAQVTLAIGGAATCQWY